MSDLVVGAAGLARCAGGAATPEYQRYHDEEWGVVLRGDMPIYERMTLEAFQSGLSWLTILRKRDGFRAAFDGFEIGAVAAYGDRDVERLLGDARIVRNRAKILAAITNARAAHALIDERGEGAFDALIWSYAPPARGQPPLSFADVPAVTQESTALAKDLKKRGFVFVGPTTLYALMQAVGMVDDHVDGCHRRGAGAF
ncbi:MAG: DNA-3-methyladenine glycosylase I [Candidatus Nanopelagicales bacterium]